MTAQTGTLRSEDALAEIDRWFGERFARLADLGAELISGLRLGADSLLEIPTGSRKGMKAAAVRFLAENPVVDGCGLIFAHSALGTEDGRLEWWVREDESRFARYSFGVAPGGDRYYDYEQHEWFVQAFSKGRVAAVGPYIDYLGVEEYLLTLTIPAEVDGRRVGAVGTDIRAADLEAELLPTVLACDRTCVVLGNHGNVLLANSSAFLPGRLLPVAPAEFSPHPVGPEGSGLRVLLQR